MGASRTCDRRRRGLGRPQGHGRGGGPQQPPGLAFGRRHALYELEIAHDSLLSESPEGALIKVAPDGKRSTVVDGPFFPGGLEIGGAGKLYVTNCGICFDDGEVLRISP